MKSDVTPQEFVNEFYLLKQSYLESTLSFNQPVSAVGVLRQKLGLAQNQQIILTELLDAAITDILYTVLFGLDGEAQIGSKQVSYTVLDEQGNKICGDGMGEIEALAYYRFHQK